VVTTVAVWNGVASELKIGLIYGGGNTCTSLKGSSFIYENTGTCNSSTSMKGRFPPI